MRLSTRPGAVGQTVAAELFRRSVGLAAGSDLGNGRRDPEVQQPTDRESAPEWFGALRRFARKVERHDAEAVRASIAQDVAVDRRLRQSSETVNQELNAVCDEDDRALAS